MATIQTTDSIRPKLANKPLDQRTRITSISALSSITLPFVGMLIYCEDTKKIYKVTALNSSKDAVASYVEIQSQALKAGTGIQILNDGTINATGEAEVDPSSISSASVGHTPSTESGMTSTNVKDALDELGEKIKDVDMDADSVTYDDTKSTHTEGSVGEKVSQLAREIGGTTEKEITISEWANMIYASGVIYAKNANYNSFLIAAEKGAKYTFSDTEAGNISVFNQEPHVGDTIERIALITAPTEYTPDSDGIYFLLSVALKTYPSKTSTTYKKAIEGNGLEEKVSALSKKIEEAEANIDTKADTIKVASSRNLFNKNDLLFGWISTDGNIIEDTTGKYKLSNKIEVEAGENYYFTKDSSISYCGLRLLDADDNPIKVNGRYSASTSELVSAPANAKYFQFQVIFNGTGDEDGFQFEKGTEPTEHTEYTTRKVLVEDEYTDDLKELLAKSNVSDKKNVLKLNLSSGGYSDVVSPYNDTENLVLRLEVNSNRQNNVFNYRNLLKQNISDGTETILKSCNDDICPVLLGSGATYIGANHGAFGMVKATCSGHDKTVADIGSVWTDGTTNYIIVGVATDKIHLISENQATYPQFEFKVPSTTATFTHVSGATNTSSFTISELPAVSLRQWYPCCKTISRKVYLNDEEITESGNYNFDVMKVAETYDIINPASALSIIKSNVGKYTENVDPSEIGADKMLRINNVYTINGADEQFVASTLTFYQSLLMDFFGFTQSEPVGEDVRNMYIPKAKSLDGDTSLDFRTIVDMKGKGGKVLTTDSEDGVLPCRFLQFDKSVELGQELDYLPNVGIAKDRNANSYGAIYFSANGDVKLYPMGWGAHNTQVDAYSHKSAICRRKFIKSSLIDTGGVISTSVYEYDNVLYVTADFNAVGVYEIDIPSKYQGKAITIDAKRDNVSLMNDVSSEKLLVKVDSSDVDYGYIEMRIE